MSPFGLRVRQDEPSICFSNAASSFFETASQTRNSVQRFQVLVSTRPMAAATILPSADRATLEMLISLAGLSKALKTCRLCNCCAGATCAANNRPPIPMSQRAGRMSRLLLGLWGFVEQLFHVPEQDGRVNAGRRQHVAIRRKSESLDVPARFQGGERAIRLHVP